MDVALLTEVNALNPFCTPANWAEVAARANDAIRRISEGAEEISERSFQDRVDLLIRHFVSKNCKVLKKYVEMHAQVVQPLQSFLSLRGGGVHLIVFSSGLAQLKITHKR